MTIAMERYMSICDIHGKDSPGALAVGCEIEREFADDWEALNRAPWPYLRTPRAGAGNDRPVARADTASKHTMSADRYIMTLSPDELWRS
jgi:hypothetical protein